MASPKKSVAKEAGQDKASGSPPEFTSEQELSALRDMLLIRRFEEKAGQLYGMGAIGGFCHLYSGPETVVVGRPRSLNKAHPSITHSPAPVPLLASRTAPVAQGRRPLRHSASGGRRHGCPPRQGRRGQGDRLVPRRHRALYPGDAALPLPRPFGVPPRQISPPRGGRENPPRPGPDRTGAQPPAGSQGRRAGAEGDRREGARDRQCGGGLRPARSGARRLRTIYRHLPLTARTAYFGAPMPIQVLMPALSPTMEKGNLAKWLKKEGEAIRSGDVIAEIETDKATMEVEATDEGTLGQILIPEGTADVAVNTPIATILSDGESAADLKAAAPAKQEKAAESAPPAQAKAPAPAAKSGGGEEKKTPSAPHTTAETHPEVPSCTKMA